MGKTIFRRDLVKHTRLSRTKIDASYCCGSFNSDGKSRQNDYSFISHLYNSLLIYSLHIYICFVVVFLTFLTFSICL